jgi:hypothetical protein
MRVLAVSTRYTSERIYVTLQFFKKKKIPQWNGRTKEGTTAADVIIRQEKSFH